MCTCSFENRNVIMRVHVFIELVRTCLKVFSLALSAFTFILFRWMRRGLHEMCDFENRLKFFRETCDAKTCLKRDLYEMHVSKFSCPRIRRSHVTVSHSLGRCRRKLASWDRYSYEFENVIVCSRLTKGCTCGGKYSFDRHRQHHDFLAAVLVGDTCTHYCIF